MTERKVMYRTFKQDPSGHMSMDAQVSGFFREANLRENKILKLQQAGMIQHRKERNPLAAERSPRNENWGFDFSVPPAQAEQPRWKIPESDWGLMAKFSSQKDIYDAIYERERNFGKEAEQVRAAQRQKAQFIEQEHKKKADMMKAEDRKHAKEEEYYRHLEKLAENPHRQSNTHHAQQLSQEKKQQMEREIESMIHEFESTNPHLVSEKKQLKSTHLKRNVNTKDFSRHSEPKGLLRMNSSSSPEALASKLKETLKNEETALLKVKDLSSMKASKIREELNATHPEVLAQYRAERAAKFIEKRAENAIKPPERRNIETNIFRPGGGTVSLEKIQAEREERNKSNEREGKKTLTGNASTSSIPIAALQVELAKTQAEIDRQKLKMSLHSNTSVAKLHAKK